MLLLSSADFFQNNILKKNLSGTLSHYQIVKQFGFRLGSKLFAKVISRRQKSLLARKEFIDLDLLFNPMAESIWNRQSKL